MADRTLLSKHDAELQGLSRYYTGKICRNGHLTDRMVANGGCVGCAAAYRQNNRKSAAAYHRVYQAKNKARLNEKRKTNLRKLWAD